MNQLLFIFSVSFLLFANQLAASIDLELSLSVSRPDITQYESSVFTYTLYNAGDETATGVEVSFDFGNDVVPVGEATVLASSGNFQTIKDQDDLTGLWRNISVPAKSQVTLELELFNLVPELRFVAVVTAMNQIDVDSSPGSLDEYTNEDDEVLFFPSMPNIDLELTLNVEDTPELAIGGKRIQLTLYNNSAEDAYRVKVTAEWDESVKAMFDNYAISSTGSQFNDETKVWQVDELLAYHSARLDLYMIPTTEDYTIYAQVTSANRNDEDSTPKNGICCVTLEDDEVVYTFNPVTNDPSNSFSKNIVNLDALSCDNASLYPNPAINDEVIITINKQLDTAATVYIYNQLGSIIRQEVVNPYQTIMKVNLPKATFPSGLYYVTMVSDHFKWREVLVIR